MSEPKLGPTQYAAEIARLQAEGKLPPLHEVLGAVADARKKFAPQILKARKDGEDASND